MAWTIIKLVYAPIWLIYFQQITSGNNETIDNEIIERRMQEFFELCPFTSTCYTNATFTRDNYTSEMMPCCDPCRCDSRCGTQCCPDMHVGLKSEEELFEAKTIQCVDAQYRPHSQDVQNGPSLEMISLCPFKFKDDDVAAKCERGYHDMELDGPLGRFLPVLDNHTGFIYKNIFCATCHNVNSNNLTYGHLKFTCKYYPRKITYIHDFTRIPDEDGCNFVYEVPPGTEGYPWVSKYCDRSRVDHCNVTGRWESYDIHLEKACLSYTSTFAGLFKNVHCYLCNGLTKDNMKQACELQTFSQVDEERMSFITLLNWIKTEEIRDLQRVSNQNDNSNDRCVQDIMLDPLKVHLYLCPCILSYFLVNYHFSRVFVCQCIRQSE